MRAALLLLLSVLQVSCLQVRPSLPSAPSWSPAVRTPHAPRMGLLGFFRRKRNEEGQAPSTAEQIVSGSPLPNVKVELVEQTQAKDATAKAAVSVMPIAEVLAEQIVSGSPLPSVKVELVVQTQAEDATAKAAVSVMLIAEVLGAGKSVLVGMPGAFTPTCTNKHLPGYIRNAEKFAGYGVNKICVVTTNDRFVNAAWLDALKLCMGDKQDVEKVQMISDGDGDLVLALGLVDDMGFGLGVRSKRFALLCEDGIVKHVAVDDGMDEVSASSAEKMLELVTPPPPTGQAAALNEKQIQLFGAVAVVLAVAWYASTQQ